MLQQQDLHQQLEAAGYFPGIIGGVVDLALGGEAPTACHVHPDVAFCHGTI